MKDPDFLNPEHHIDDLVQRFFGRFTRQWYGLSFSNWDNAGCQFDAPGYNSSK